MLVAPWRARRTALRRKGQPPAISTATARNSTTQLGPAVSGATSATARAASASGQEMTRRTIQWSGSASAGVGASGETGAAE